LAYSYTGLYGEKNFVLNILLKMYDSLTYHCKIVVQNYVHFFLEHAVKILTWFDYSYVY